MGIVAAILPFNAFHRSDREKRRELLTYIGQRWREVQVLRTGDDALAEMVSVDEENEPGPVLTEVETALVRYAVEELDGAFTINREVWATFFSTPPTRKERWEMESPWPTVRAPPS